MDVLAVSVLAFQPALAQPGKGNQSRLSLDFRYGRSEFASPCATLPLSISEPGRYVDLSFLPAGAAEYGIAYTLARDSTIHILAAIGFQTGLTTLDVSDSSLHPFREGEYPVAVLRISHWKGVLQTRMYSDLPGGFGVGMLRAGVGVVYVLASGVNVLEQAARFPGIRSLRPQGVWLLALDLGAGYLIPGTSVMLTANAELNLQMEFVSNRNFLEMDLLPSSPYRFQSSGVSPVFLSVGVLFDL